MAEWLNKTFNSFDSAVLEWMHQFHVLTNGTFKGFFTFISFLGNSGWFFIAIAVVFLFFAKTRKAGIAMGVALVLGVIITNVCLKNMIARERPYTNLKFYQWWFDLDGKIYSDYSFPSGHVTGAFSAMTAFFIVFNKKWSWVGFVLALLMAFSRLYLMVHYPTDVIGGMIAGLIAGCIGAFVSHILYFKSKGKFNKLLTEWNIIKLSRKRKLEQHNNLEIVSR